MSEDDAKQLAEAFVGPVRELLDRLVTVVEQLTNRVEVLELQRMYQHTADRRYDEDS